MATFSEPFAATAYTRTAAHLRKTSSTAIARSAARLRRWGCTREYHTVQFLLPCRDRDRVCGRGMAARPVAIRRARAWSVSACGRADAAWDKHRGGPATPWGARTSAV